VILRVMLYKNDFSHQTMQAWGRLLCCSGVAVLLQCCCSDVAVLLQLFCNGLAMVLQCVACVAV